MASSGREYIRTAWWYPTFQGLAIFTTVIGFNLLGDAIRDILDPINVGGNRKVILYEKRQ
ncbi:hypothetical protein KGY79_13880 [Candidatus Bipolaricaulota bacterium]|nr:hypothetical protein [Candidatus Bipolaricaulota bacterium]